MTTDEKILRIAFHIGQPVFWFKNAITQEIYTFNSLDSCFDALIEHNKITKTNTPFDVYFEE